MIPQLDLRGWLDEVKRINELAVLEGAHWDLEIGCATALGWQKASSPAFLFDGIPDYPRGHRVLTNATTNAPRIAATFGLPPPASTLDFIATMRTDLKEWGRDLDNFPPREVASGAIFENIQEGDRIDLWGLPTPRWHEMDGGRYIGTGDAVITQDPDSGEVNVGTYRVMVSDRKTVTLFITHGKHGRIHYEKYHARGQACPVAISFGHHPLLFRIACLEVPAGKEYHYVGAIAGKSVPVIKEEITGLPVPADAEIVIAGFCPPGLTRPEGPFGEWTGYYASGEGQAPFVEVERVYYRHNPIILGSPPGKAPDESSYYRGIIASALLHDELDAAGVPDVKGVWMGEAGYNMLVVVSIKQRYAGHARQAALLASHLARRGFFGRYVIVVDEDIDPTNMQEVLWAVCTRSDPETDIDVLRRCWSTVMDPVIRKPADGYFNSRAIIDACKPYEWIDEFPREIKIDNTLIERVKKKWSI